MVRLQHGRHIRSGLASALLLIPFAARAATIEAGTGTSNQMPSAAIAKAQPGDTVRIAPGTYYDCAVLSADRVTVEGSGPGTVLTDKTCQGKALLIVDGRNDTIADLTLQRARVADGNGAGIRAEGGDLTVRGVRFVNDQDGILTADNHDATLRILDSTFEQDGHCEPDHGCGHGIYAGVLGLLDVERTRLTDTRDGHAIKSRALRTTIVDTTIEDGPTGTASYEVDLPNGGTLSITGSTIEKGPNASNHGAAISIGEEGVDRPTDSIVIRDNRFTNDNAHETVFVRNLTATPVQMDGNTLTGKVRPLEGDGSAH